MNWFQQNRWLGTFLIVFGVSALLILVLVFRAKSGFNQALARFNETAAEKISLEKGDPFPSEANNRKMKIHIENYRTALEKFKEELKTFVLPAAPTAPNEFQSRLRQAMLTTAEKARANRVKLPDNFALGFEEYTAALPNTAVAPLLGQELAQIELLMNILIESRVDGISAFARTPLPDERGSAGASPTPAPGRKPAPTAAGPKLIERGTVDITFASTASATRKVLNQIASSRQQFFIKRVLHVRNEKDKGPPREQPAAQTTTGATPQATPAKPASNTAITFIVGNEHLETSARIEIVRVAF